jgi:hypothetical protein
MNKHMNVLNVSNVLNRRNLIVGLLAMGTLLSGCGSSGNKVETGTRSGTLADMLIGPAPGAFAISRDTVFRLQWPEGTTPPPKFEVRLYKYQDERSSDFPRENVIQDTKLTRLGDRFVWDVVRSNNLALDSGGVYYLQVKTSTEEVFASYIVAVSRSVSPTNSSVSPERTSVVAPTGDATTGTVTTGTVHQISLR